MSDTTVVNVKTDKYDIYIGRSKEYGGPSVWSNPYKIGMHGDRVEVIRLYKNHLLRLLDNSNPINKTSDPITKRLLRLKGKRLGCHCKPLACHGDALVEILEGE